MSNRNIVPDTGLPVPVDLGTLFAKPPLLASEDPQAYGELQRQIAHGLKPKDALERIWLHDIVHLTWEIQRLRRLGADFVNRAGNARVDGRGGRTEEDPLAGAIEHWRRAAGSASAPALESAPARRPEPAPLTEWDLAAAFADKIETYERIDKLLASAEHRRNALLLEIEHRREAHGRRLRNASDEIIDADYQETPPSEERGGGS